MKQFSTCEVVDTLKIKGTSLELCASAEALYDEATSTMKTHLKSFLRPVSHISKEQRADWLPGNETVTDHLSAEEMIPAARAIFNEWVTKIKHVIPGGMKV